MQVQNQLNAFIVLAAFLWCVLAAVTMILQEHSTQAAVIQLWYALNSFWPTSDQISVCVLHSAAMSSYSLSRAARLPTRACAWEFAAYSGLTRLPTP